jgi:hypothetical protein
VGLDAGQHSGIADLVTVEMQDRQHSPIPDGIEELVGMPRGGQRTRLSFSVTDDAGHNQFRVVECRAECVAQ